MFGCRRGLHSSFVWFVRGVVSISVEFIVVVSFY